MNCAALYLNICVIFGLIFFCGTFVEGRRVVIYVKNDIGRYCTGFSFGGKVNLTYGANSTIKLTAENLPSNINDICQFQINVPTGFGANIHIQSSLFKTWWTRNECVNLLEMESNGEWWKKVTSEKLCDNFYSNVYDSLNTHFTDGVIIKFNTSLLRKHLLSFHSLNVYVTTYTQACSNYWFPFHCSNFRCISDDLICNDVDNCGDNSDESDDTCEITTTTSRYHVVTYTVTPVLVLAIVYIALRCCGICCQTKPEVTRRVIVVPEVPVDDAPPPYHLLVNENSATVKQVSKPSQNSLSTAAIAASRPDNTRY